MAPNDAEAEAATQTPLARYHAEIERLGWVRDPAQEAIARRLDELHRALVAWRPPRRRLFRRPEPVAPVRGLYLWGDTGRGKTWLVDLFYQCLPFREKTRRHFHRFMADVHDGLRRHREHADPLGPVADELAARARVVCFDEFFVSDIADAMILGTLLEKLFARGVTLVATSNVPPAELYRDGLQRARFLPAIEQIERHTEVVPVGGETDYRFRLLERAGIYHVPLDAKAEAGLQALFDDAAPQDTRNRGPLRVLEEAEIYHAPLDEAADRNLARYFRRIASGREESGRTLTIQGRPVRTVRLARGVAWFEFAELCDGPRSQADYIEIARSFDTVLVGGVPQFTAENENEARRFIALVDEFYERRVNLILSAAAPPDELYRGRRLAFEFERTVSRLVEMQSREYLAAPHLA
jgi:cell division protein ZapE